jgi:hypothetical protein
MKKKTCRRGKTGDTRRAKQEKARHKDRRKTSRGEIQVERNTGRGKYMQGRGKTKCDIKI